MLASVMVMAQVELKNASSAKIKVLSLDGLNVTEIPAGKISSIAYLREDQGTVKAKIMHSTYQPGNGFNYVDDGEFTLPMRNGIAIFSNPKQRQAGISSTSKKTEKTQPVVEKKEKPVEKKFVGLAKTKSELSPFINSSATFFVQNCCTMTITGYSGLLEGLCLKTKKTSKTKVTSPTGPIQSAIGYDTDPDNKVTGAKQKWAVLYKSITENLDTLKIYNENLVLVNTGVKITKPFNNYTDKGYLITTDGVKASGKTIAPRLKKKPYFSSQKMEFYLGWNVLTFQYLDGTSKIRQVVLMFMVTKDQETVNLKEKTGDGNSISEKDLKIE